MAGRAGAVQDHICDVRGPHTQAQHELVWRQARAWITNDCIESALDWHSRGVLTAPRGVCVAAPEIPGVIAQWHGMFGDLEIAIESIAASADGTWLWIEWGWTVTRRSDGRRGRTADAIVVEIDDGAIVGWREYFDTWNSVEFGP